MASREFEARGKAFWDEREKLNKKAKGIEDQSEKKSRSSLFGRFSKVDVEVTIKYRVPDDLEVEYHEEFREASKLILKWFPKHVTIKEQQLAYSSQASGLTFDLLVGKDIVHTNTYLQQGKFTTAGSKEHDFVKRVISDSISGKEPDLNEFQKMMKAAKDKQEDDSMRQAKDAADLLAAEKKKEREAKKARLEQLKKAKEEEAKRKAEEEAAKAQATKIQVKAKTKTKTKMGAMPADKVSKKAQGETIPKAKEQKEVSDKAIEHKEVDGIKADEETGQKLGEALPCIVVEKQQTATPGEAERREESGREKADVEDNVVIDTVEVQTSDACSQMQAKWEWLEESCTSEQDDPTKLIISEKIALIEEGPPSMAKMEPCNVKARTGRAATACSGFFFCCSSSPDSNDESGDAPARMAA
mmetsp:Transcript_30747/g.56048  ORF Transcript_30747/g.56048 Transcript_30747/m.56048 type:complete len:415 (-) Transcript_30747:283-1527(-)